MNFFKNASIYFISNIVNAIIPFLLLPILTRYLTPEDYGQVAIFQTTLGAISTFIGLNSVGAANRKFYDDDKSNSLKEYNGACIQILIISSLMVLMLILSFQDSLSRFLSLPTSWIIYAIIVSFCSFLIFFRLGQWQIRGQAKLFAALQIASSLINVMLSLLFVVSFNSGAEGRIDAQIIATVIGAAIACLLLFRDKLVNLTVIRIDYIVDALKFGVPLIPHSLGFFLILSVDRFVINQNLGLKEAGIYMVAFQLSSFLSMIFDAINKSFVPWLFEKLKRDNENEKKDIVKKTYLYFCFLAVLAFCAFLIGPVVIAVLVGQEYQEAKKLIGLLCLGQIFGGMYLMVTNYIFFAKKTFKLSLITISTGILNVCLLMLFIVYFGLIGAAIAFAISRFIQFSATWILAARSVNMRWISNLKVIK